MNDNRPTLEEQIAVGKMTDEECIRALTGGNNPLRRLDMLLHWKCHLAWNVLHWNWFNIWTGERGFWLWARHGFREWGKPSIVQEVEDE